MEYLKAAVENYGKGKRFSNARAVSQHGRREDLGGIAFRSKAEANIARWLSFKGIEWQYEAREFEFPVKRGNRFYKPDFFLPGTGDLYEVKGWMNPESLVKLRRLKNYYRKEFDKLYLVDAGMGVEGRKRLALMRFPDERIIDYRAIHSHGRCFIPSWE
jgi:hypothetical protein